MVAIKNKCGHYIQSEELEELRKRTRNKDRFVGFMCAILLIALLIGLVFAGLFAYQAYEDSYQIGVKHCHLYGFEDYKVFSNKCFTEHKTSYSGNGYVYQEAKIE